MNTPVAPQIECEMLHPGLSVSNITSSVDFYTKKLGFWSVNSCLEEILLHTNEPLGDGVASPHTKRDLDYIQKLKAKHGIDYGSHASYRFVEE
jgi:catechol 2,3-dioxygenase-like lactoylglutathione lyase family enzyme